MRSLLAFVTLGALVLGTQSALGGLLANAPPASTASGAAALEHALPALGQRLFANPLGAGAIARQNAAPFVASHRSAGAVLRAQALSEGFALPPPAPPLSTDPVAAIAAAYVRAGTPLTAAKLASVSANLASLPAADRLAIADIVSATTASLPLRAAAFAKLTPTDSAAIARGTVALPTQPFAEPAGSRAEAALLVGATLKGLASFESREALFATYDQASALRGDVLVADAVDRAGLALAAQSSATTPVLDEPTPYGDIIIKGTGNDVNTEDAFLLVDPAGADSYPADAATATGNPTPLENDLSNSSAPPPADIIAAAQTRIILDLDGGDSFSSAQSENQGYGSLGGFGLIVDGVSPVSEPDTYTGGSFVQGAGYFAGVGLLVDGSAGSSFTAISQAQGEGQAAGTGILSSWGSGAWFIAQVFAQGVGFDGGFGSLTTTLGGNSFLCTSVVDTSGVIVPVLAPRPLTACHAVGMGGAGLLASGAGGNRYDVAYDFQASALAGASALVDAGNGPVVLNGGEWSNGMAVLGASVVSLGPGQRTLVSNQDSAIPWSDIYIGSNGEGYEGVGVVTITGPGSTTAMASAEKTLWLPQYSCTAGCSYLGSVGALLAAGDGSATYSGEFGEGATLDGGYGLLADQSGGDTFQLTDGSYIGQGAAADGFSLPFPPPPVIFLAAPFLGCNVGYLVEGAGGNSYSNGFTTWGVRGAGQTWREDLGVDSYGRGADSAPGIAAYLQNQAPSDALGLVNADVCQSLVAPIG